MTKENQPATKGDLAGLKRELELKLDGFKEEIVRHFDVVVENAMHDLHGARSDQIELLKDSHRSHEQRLRRLERHYGLIA